MTLLAMIRSIHSALETLTRQHRVPGASLAVLHDDLMIETATGITSVDTGVPATSDALFQIGSITKVYTTTLVMQLVDQGSVDLDAPVRRYLPELRLGGEPAVETITVRHLLNHSSGIPGDHFADFAAGDDGLSRYVESLGPLAPAHGPGELYSYSNAGMCVAGRLVEVVTGQPFATVLRERLLRPLGATATTARVEEALGHRYAVGHLWLRGSDRPVPSSPISISPSMAPAGSVTAAPAREVLALARLHLNGGRGVSGERVLSEASVQAMQTPTVRLWPAGDLGAAGSVGLGWMTGHWGGHRVFGHDGGTVGQHSFLWAVPDERLVVCLLTNATPGGIAVWRQLARWLFDEVAAVTMGSVPEPAEPAEAATATDLDRYAGCYESVGLRVEVTPSADGELAMAFGGIAASTFGRASTPTRWRPVAADTFVGPARMTISFVGDDGTGHPRYLHTGRALRRTPSPAVA